MSGNQVKLANGEFWTWKQFLEHFFDHTGTGSPTPVAGRPLPIVVDRSWYMEEGPGRYYHPGMFPIIGNVIRRSDFAPATYDLWQLAPKGEKDDSVKASVSHYITDPFSNDWWTRAFVFGNESARISGQVVVNPDGSKTFHNIEIRPFNTDFNFNNKNAGPLLESLRGWGRQEYDSGNLGISYDINFPTEGRGRVYYPFTDSQLGEALQNSPEATPFGLLPSVTTASPVYLDQYRQYLDQTKPDTSSGAAGSPAPGLGVPNFSNSSISNWIAGLAGADATNPMQPAPQTADKLRGIVSNQPMPDWPVPPPIFNTR